jgi:hypothetical protein
VTRSAPDVETLACAAAGGYAGRWARSVARPRPDDAADAPAPWLVDGYAGADLQRAALRGITPTSPAASFFRAADEAFGGGARIVLVEEDPGLLARVEDALRSAGAGDRLRRAGDPATVGPGEIALVEAPFASVVARLAGEIADAPALVRLAPLSARVLPWSVLELLADLSGADLLIRLPQEDFARAGKFPGPLADFPPHLRRVVEACSALLADARHGWLLAWREAMRAGGEDAALAGMIERLRGLLGDGGEQRTARAARVEGTGGAVHLLLSTPHPEHALELNGAVMDAGASPPAAPRPSRARRAAGSETTAAAPPPDAAPPSPAPAAAPSPPASAPAEPAPDLPAPAPSPAPPPVDEASPPPAAFRVPPPLAPEPPALDARAPLLDLFALADTPAAPAEPEPPRGHDPRAVADGLYARHAGRRVPYRELLAELADAGLAPEQVRTALGLLKRDRRAAYRSLDADGAEVEFLAEPAAPPPAPKARKPRKPVPGLLGLFDDPEEPADDPPAVPVDAAGEPPPNPVPGAPNPEDDPPMSMADIIEPVEDDDLPMTLADAIGGLESDVADVREPEPPAADPPRKPGRRKGK